MGETLNKRTKNNRHFVNVGAKTETKKRDEKKKKKGTLLAKGVFSYVLSLVSSFT